MSKLMLVLLALSAPGIAGCAVAPSQATVNCDQPACAQMAQISQASAENGVLVYWGRWRPHPTPQH